MSVPICDYCLLWLTFCWSVLYLLQVFLVCNAFQKDVVSSNGLKTIWKHLWRWKCSHTNDLLLTLMLYAGLSYCNRWACSSPNGANLQRISWVLLPCMIEHHQWRYAHIAKRSFRTISCRTHGLQEWKCSTWRHLSSMTAFTCILSSVDPALQSTKQALLIYYWVKAHQSCQRAILAIQQTSDS